MRASELEELMGVQQIAPRAITADHFAAEHGMTDEQLAIHRQVKSDMGALAAQIHAASILGIPLVYAVLRTEEPVVKIGYSRNLHKRLRRMPGCRLVAVRPGDRHDEQRVHEQLADSRVRVALRGGGITEHFLLTDQVQRWINETRASLGLDILDIA